MSKAMQLVGIILLGIFTLAVIYLMSDVRSTNDLDYYLLQEVTEASMYDAVDYSYYRETGLLKVDRDMFLESFNRRFAESVTNNRDYTIKIIDFNETPPKVSVEVTAPTVASIKGEVALITNRVSGIIETIYDDYVYSRGGYGLDNYDDIAPEVNVIDSSNNVYTVQMTDNYMLEKYAIVDLGSNGINQFTNSVYNSITDWVYINDFVRTYTIQTTIPNGTNGRWVVAVDRGGLWTAAPITDINPWISNWAYNPSNEGSISATFVDDRGLAFYEITPIRCSGNVGVDRRGSATCNGNWIAIGSKNIVAITDATVNNDGYYTKTKNINVNQADYYELVVKDNGGHASTPVYIQGNRNHEITIDWSVNGNQLSATIFDTYGDLSGYKITNSETTPNTWDAVTFTDVVNINVTIDPSRVYYIHAKDNAGQVVKSRVILSQTIVSNSYGVEEGCSGAWSDNGNTGCWAVADRTSLDQRYIVDTNNYSYIDIDVSNLNFRVQNDHLNCAAGGRCSYVFGIEIGGTKVIFQSWSWLHQDGGSLRLDSDRLLGNNNYGNVRIDLNALGLKNVGNKEFKFYVEMNSGGGEYHFTANVNSVKLSN